MTELDCGFSTEVNEGEREAEEENKSWMKPHQIVLHLYQFQIPRTGNAFVTKQDFFLSLDEGEREILLS